jgi:outer membrane receptor protein involved in Fe transport
MSSKTKASLGLIARLADQASLGIQARFESEKAIYDDYNNDSPKLPSFAEFDLSYNRELSSTTDLQMSITNVTDKQRFAYGVRSAGSENYVPNEGRIIRLGLTHRF